MIAGMNNDELDSQLSAMFDNELPEPECELLARRLARDEALKVRWGRYATIGAAIRAEGGLHLQNRLAQRVSAAISAEPALLVGSSPRGRRGLASPAVMRWWQPLAGVALAGSVAALAVLWMRQQSPLTALVAQTTGGTDHSLPGPASPRQVEPDSYVVPALTEQTSLVPPTTLANFVVAHSEFSTPLVRHNLLSALVGAESGTVGAPASSESPKPRRIESAEQTR